MGLVKHVLLVVCSLVLITSFLISFELLIKGKESVGICSEGKSVNDKLDDEARVKILHEVIKLMKAQENEMWSFFFWFLERFVEELDAPRGSFKDTIFKSTVNERQSLKPIEDLWKAFERSMNRIPRKKLAEYYKQELSKKAVHFRRLKVNSTKEKKPQHTAAVFSLPSYKHKDSKSAHKIVVLIGKYSSKEHQLKKVSRISLGTNKRFIPNGKLKGFARNENTLIKSSVIKVPTQSKKAHKVSFYVRKNHAANSNAQESSIMKKKSSNKHPVANIPIRVSGQPVSSKKQKIAKKKFLAMKDQVAKDILKKVNLHADINFIPHGHSDEKKNSRITFTSNAVQVPVTEKIQHGINLDAHPHLKQHIVFHSASFNKQKNSRGAVQSSIPKETEKVKDSSSHSGRKREYQSTYSAKANNLKPISEPSKAKEIKYRQRYEV